MISVHPRRKHGTEPQGYPLRARDTDLRRRKCIPQGCFHRILRRKFHFSDVNCASRPLILRRNLKVSVEELRSSPVSSLMRSDIFVSQVEDLQSSPLSGLMTFKILKTLNILQDFFEDLKVFSWFRSATFTTIKQGVGRSQSGHSKNPSGSSQAPHRKERGT